MAELEIPISYQLTTGKPVDKYYGPYPDIATANAGVPAALRSVGILGGVVVGRTVGIVVDGVPAEYWWIGGTADGNLAPKSPGSSTPPPEETPLFQLLSGGEYNYDEDVADTFAYKLAPQNGIDEDGNEFTLGETPFVLDPAADGMTRYDVPVINTDGTFEIITGPEAETRVYPTGLIPEGAFALTPIVVNPDESHPYTDNVPTRLKDGVTAEVRPNSQTFASIDTQEDLNGVDADEHFDLDHASWQDSDSIAIVETVDPDTGERKHSAQYTGSLGHTIEDEGVTLPQQNTLNFTGLGVTVTDVDGKTQVSIPGYPMPPNGGNILYVSPQGSNTDGLRGSIAAPFLTLQAANDAASSNDLIYVLPGSYGSSGVDFNLYTSKHLYISQGATINCAQLYVRGTETIFGKGIVNGIIIMFGDFVDDLTISGITINGRVKYTAFNVTSSTNQQLKLNDVTINSGSNYALELMHRFGGFYHRGIDATLNNCVLTSTSNHVIRLQDTAGSDDLTVDTPNSTLTIRNSRLIATDITKSAISAGLYFKYYFAYNYKNTGFSGTGTVTNEWASTMGDGFSVGESSGAGLINKDTFTGNGSQTAFTLSSTVTTALIVAVAGIVAAAADYSASGTTLTITVAPATGEEILILYV